MRCTNHFAKDLTAHELKILEFSFHTKLQHSLFTSGRDLPVVFYGHTNKSRAPSPLQASKALPLLNNTLHHDDYIFQRHSLLMTRGNEDLENMWKALKHSRWKHGVKRANRALSIEPSEIATEEMTKVTEAVLIRWWGTCDEELRDSKIARNADEGAADRSGRARDLEERCDGRN